MTSKTASKQVRTDKAAVKAAVAARSAITANLAALGTAKAA